VERERTSERNNRRKEGRKKETIQGDREGIVPWEKSWYKGSNRILAEVAVKLLGDVPRQKGMFARIVRLHQSFSTGASQGQDEFPKSTESDTLLTSFDLRACELQNNLQLEIIFDKGFVI
jgi:hypothetical protein